MNFTPDAWYSVLTFRKKSIGLIMVDAPRIWWQTGLIDLANFRIHPTALQFVRSTMGSIRAKIEQGKVPTADDLVKLHEKLHGDVRLSLPLPLTGGYDQMWVRTWRDRVTQPVE
jgi:hypothetical protein